MSVIVALEVENIKRIRAAGISPNGLPCVIVGGEENQGKSSILDSIQYAFGGEKGIPAKPLRNGSTKGRVFVDLGDMTVERIFTEKGSRLIVKNKAGDTKASPQQILDKLCGKLAFDPLEFSRQKPAEQLLLLRELTGLDFGAMDAERARSYADRTAENRTVKQLEAELAAQPRHDSAPAEEVSVSVLSDELQAIRERNADNKQQRDDLENATEALRQAESTIVDTQQEIIELEESIELAKEKLRLQNAALAKQVSAHRLNEKAVAALVDADPAPVRERLSTAEATNQKVRDSVKYAETKGKLDSAHARSKALTDRIDEIDTAKAKMIAEAKFPVGGLGFDENGITFNGLPFEQAASSQRLRVSAAMGLAMNPTLRVMLIRDGSLMGQPSLEMLAELAREHDAQIWIERVSVGDEVSVVIEDGAVKEDRTELATAH